MNVRRFAFLLLLIRMIRVTAKWKTRPSTVRRSLARQQLDGHKMLIVTQVGNGNIDF